MEPDIQDGSLLFIDKSKTNITKAGVYMINTKDGLYIKCIKIENDKVILKSYNKTFEDIQTTINDVNIVGKVCGIVNKI